MTDQKQVPERIWAYAWTGKERRQGQWDYIDTSAYYGNVYEFVRKDLYDAAIKQRDELAKELVFHAKDAVKERNRAEKAEAELDKLAAMVIDPAKMDREALVRLLPTPCSHKENNHD